MLGGLGRGVYVAGPGVSGSELGCFFVVTVHSLVFLFVRSFTAGTPTDARMPKPAFLHIA